MKNHKVTAFISVFLLLLAPGLAKSAAAAFADPRIHALVALRAIASAVTATTRYVKPNGTGSGTGSWSNASGNLQAMISASTANDEIWVASGTYKPGTQTTDSFTLGSTQDRIRILGGFEGTDANPTARDPNALTNNTVLSGDIGAPGDPSDNCETVVKMTGVTAPTLLESFTITGGNNPTGIGAGIYLTNASPTILNCRVMGNVAADGGGMYWVSGSSPVIQDCYFLNNSAGNGGAIYCRSGTNARIEDCTLESNAQTDAGAGGGGAMYVFPSNITLTVTGCRFEDNVALGPDGAGAIQNRSSGTCTVLNSSFIGNEARNGGAGAVLHLSSSASGISLTNCLFSRNVAVGSGGAFLRGTGSTSPVSLVNCAFCGNRAIVRSNARGGGARFESGGAGVLIANSIFWGNTSSAADPPAPDPDELQRKQISYGGSTPPTVTYTVIQDLVAGGVFDNGGTNHHNTAGDPMFVSAAADNLRVIPGSSAIDSADNCALLGSVTTDLDGADRRVDDSTTDSGADGCHNPASTTFMDRGAYEFNRGLDCDGNTRNDNEDIYCGGGNNCGGIDGAFDCNRNGVPDQCGVPHVKWTHGLEIHAAVS